MRVFCHEHKKSFFAPRQSPIKCENRGHSLGELDFDGSSSVPVNLEWQYCCNCEHFCPINFNQDGLETCPVCTRRSSVLYICDKCYTVSFESNTALQIKNFTLNKDGAPQPSCPGCLQETVSDLHEHACDDAKTTFVTGLNSCPICHERLDIGPSFPSLVTDYLKRTRAAHKTNVTFDYDSGLFVPVNDGEFVLIHGSDAGKLMILPRASRFETKRDFYEFYQDYYHCAKPLNGAVQILEPAEVESIGDGFALRKSGLLEVVADAPKRASAPNPANVPKPASPAKPASAANSANAPKPASPAKPASAANPANAEKPASPAKPANARRQETNPLVESVPQAPVVESPKEEPGVILCTCCESMIETKYTFCWKCGSRLDSKSGFGSQRLEMELADDDEEEESTVQHEPRPFRRTTVSFGSQDLPPTDNRNGRTIFKLICIVLFGLLTLSVAIFALTRSSSQVATTVAQPVTPTAENVQPVTEESPKTVDKSSAIAQTTPIKPEDAELKKLRDSRIAANKTDRPRILQSFAKTEKRFPNDYRFPYERAKFTLMGHETIARKQAFDALSVAAQKAIKTGKAEEMLGGLEADKIGDFQALTRVRHEWTQLTEALKRQDATRLSER